MRWRVGFISIFALLIVLVAIFPTATPAGAAPKVAFGLPTIVKHVILDEFSIDGPSLWEPNIVSGVPGTGPGLVLAWTGTDHRLNTLVGRSSTLTFPSKHTYNETSSFRPAVTTVSGEGVIYLAWTGTDPNHSLNVLASSGGTNGGPRKVTLWNENSFTAPALAVSGNNLLLIWAGTDPNHSLNVCPIDLQTFKVGTKTILRQFSSIARPSVAPDPNTNRLLLTWAATSPLHRIRFATSSDGVHWTQPSGSPLAEWSAVGPSILALKITGMPHYYLGWTGTDPHHSVNVQYTERFPTWPLDNTKTTFGEWALGGPALANGSPDTAAPATRQVVLGWTGTDRLHHLNVALVEV